MEIKGLLCIALGFAEMGEEVVWGWYPMAGKTRAGKPLMEGD